MKIEKNTYEHFKAFAENLTLTGDFDGENFQLLKWQEDVARAIFKKNKNGKNEVSKLFLGIPRKNGVLPPSVIR